MEISNRLFKNQWYGKEDRGGRGKGVRHSALGHEGKGHCTSASKPRDDQWDFLKVACDR